MTQLLLFDAPAHSSFSVPAESPQCPAGRPEREVQQTRRGGGPAKGAAERRDRQAGPTVSAEEGVPPRGGMHHMGDLANLVIARYELVAKRRAALLARGPLPSVRF